MNEFSKSILIAGGAGFVGSHLAERLLSEGHTISVVDDLSTGRRNNLQNLLAHPRFQFRCHDVVQPLDFRGPLDWVMNLASPASPVAYLRRPIETLRANAEGTRHLLELAERKNAQFFLASTSEVYGDPAVHPQDEGYWGHVNPIGPRSVYDESKRYAESLVACYQRERGLRIRIVRIFNTYGPRMQLEDGRVVTNFIVQALTGQPITLYGDGSQTRSFQFISDLIEGIVRLMQVPYQRPVNLGNPAEYRVAELAQLILDLTDSSSELSFAALPADDPRQRKPNIELAHRLLDWEPRVPLVEGLSETIAYCKPLVGAHASAIQPSVPDRTRNCVCSG